MAIMKNLVQRTDDWFAWRKEGITASMIPVIMGLSPYQTPYQLWAELVGLKEPDDLSKNYHVQRGVEQEPEARDKIERIYGNPYMPLCVEADHNSLFKASLDGLFWTEDFSEVLEIKCPCEKIYLEIVELKQNAPTFKMYEAQVQWQINCSGANQAKLFFYLRGREPIGTQINADLKFIMDAEKAALAFWEMVQTKTPPALISGRDKVVYHEQIKGNDPQWHDHVNQYKAKAKSISELESQLKEMKSQLKEMETFITGKIPTEVNSFSKDGLLATRVDREGSVDYDRLLADLGRKMNKAIPQGYIDSFRKEGKSYFRITVTDKSEVTPTTPVTTATESASCEKPKTEVTGKKDVQDVDTQQSKQPTKSATVTTIERPKTEVIKPLSSEDYFKKAAVNQYF